MLSCNCTLCYTNPNACKNCATYIQYYSTDLTTKPYEWYIYWGDILKPFDSDKYELVEKKDWKINQLKEQIAEQKRHSDNLYKYTIKQLSILEDLKRKLEELEK